LGFLKIAYPRGKMTLPFWKMTLPWLRHIMKKFNVLVVKMEKVTRYWGRVRDWYAIFFGYVIYTIILKKKLVLYISKVYVYIWGTT